MLYLKAVALAALNWVRTQEEIIWPTTQTVTAFVLLNFIFICILLFTFDVLKSGVLSV